MSSPLDTTNGVVSLHHFLAVILIVAPLGAILLPIIGVLIFFTPSESRKRPVFILNILACLLGICQAIYFACLNSYVVLHPDKPISHTTALSAIAILLTPPILIDSILLFRLLAFYPTQLTSTRTLIAILIPTFLAKSARLACLIGFLVTYPVARFDGPSHATLPGLVWGRGPWVVALLALQAIDNSCVSRLTTLPVCIALIEIFDRYVSSMFLYKLYRFGYHAQKALGGSSSEYFMIIDSVCRVLTLGPVQEDIFSRVPAVFVIALGNYLVPYAPVPLSQFCQNFG